MQNKHDSETLSELCSELIVFHRGRCYVCEDSWKRVCITHFYYILLHYVSFKCALTSVSVSSIHKLWFNTLIKFKTSKWKRFEPIWPSCELSLYQECWSVQSVTHTHTPTHARTYTRTHIHTHTHTTIFRNVKA